VGYVDLHSHVLPGLDDGVKTLAESLELIGLLKGIGFEVVCATPHQRAGMFAPTREQIDAAYDLVTRELSGKPQTLDLRLGAENFWDDVFLVRAMTSAQPSYTGGRAFLFELPPPQAPPRLEQTLFTIHTRGLLPVMAHPERYLSLCEDRARMEQLARSAALVVDLAALDGAHGARQGRAARQLVEDGLAHAAASDVHAPADAAAAAAGIAWIKKRMGTRALDRLLDDHPRRILRGELPEA
jgi:protein-tyrosine phosphatase